jgi:large subunit ribosomal protein L10
MTSLRKEARNSGVYLRVVRNTLASRALADTDFACSDTKLVGPLVLAFSQDDPAAAARLFKKFIKDNQKLQVTAISLNGKLLAANQLDTIASLPTYKEAVAQLVAVMKAPINKLVRTLADPSSRVVRTLSAIRDKKQNG